MNIAHADAVAQLGVVGQGLAAVVARAVEGHGGVVDGGDGFGDKLTGMAASPQARGLRALSVLLGVFFLFQGLGKVGWLTNPSPLTDQLTGYLENANAWNRAYLERVCIPGAPIFARMVLLGELATGVALISGAWTRSAAAAALLMILNFHFAGGLIFTYAYPDQRLRLPGGRWPASVGVRRREPARQSEGQVAP